MEWSFEAQHRWLYARRGAWLAGSICELGRHTPRSVDSVGETATDELGTGHV
jgi:hypothetical protein